MRRVTLPADSPRRGLLGHGSILTLTSAANRTSPVVRGKWVLENLLGAPPPQPPPGVETNLEKDPAQVKVDVAAAAAGAASRQPGVRVVPPADGSDRARARELRPHRQVADGRRRRRRSMPRASWSTARKLERPRVAAAGAAGAVGRVRRRSLAEKLLTYAVGPGDAARRTCRPCARSCAARRRAATGSRRSSSASCRTPQFQMRTKSRRSRSADETAGRRDVHHQEAPVAAHVPARHRRDRWRCRCSTRWCRRRRRCGRPPRRRRRASPASTCRTARRWTSGRRRPRAPASRSPRSSSRSSRSASASTSSAAWRIRTSPAPAAPTSRPAPTTRARPRCS